MCVFLRDSLDTNTNELDVTWFSEILMLLRKCVKWLTWMPESLGLCGRAGTVELTPLIIYVQKALDSFHYWIDQCISYPQKTCLHLRFNISIVKLIIFNRNEQIFSFIISLRPPFWFHSRSLCVPATTVHVVCCHCIYGQHSFDHRIQHFMLLTTKDQNSRDLPFVWTVPPILIGSNYVFSDDIDRMNAKKKPL